MPTLDTPRLLRRHRLPALFLVLAAMFQLVAGCSTPERLPAVPRQVTAQPEPASIENARFYVLRETETFVAEGKNSLRKEQDHLARSGYTGPLPPAYFLAISGGGDDGAFAAGLLNGWTAAGTRPTFKAVTGVSTGALIAPFAFLGPRYDPVLRELYTSVSQKNIYKSRGILGALFEDAMSDTTPLHRLIKRYVTRELLDEIAAEYAKGRLLFVGTTNLDTLEPVVWNLTAISTSQDPRALELFQKILLASSAIPGAFPPVLMDVEVEGKRLQEMHVDGGAMAQVFLYPPAVDLRQISRNQQITRQRVLYIIRNARLDPDWASVKRKTLSIAARAITAMIHTQGIGDLYRIYVTARRDGLDYNLAYIPPTFTVAHQEEFDTNYMRQLFDTGYAMAAAGYQWKKQPPALAATQKMAR